jgi:hypothetical protein
MLLVHFGCLLVEVSRDVDAKEGNNIKRNVKEETTKTD